MKRFTDLHVWRQGHALVLEVYRITQEFPSEERYGLVSQLRRAAVSVTSNLAEGSKRRTTVDYARFVNLAEGSLAEVQNLLLVSRDLGFLGPDRSADMLERSAEVARMLHGLRTRLDSDAIAGD